MNQPGTSVRAAVPMVAIGALVTQLIVFATSVVLARFYSPREFGEFTVALSVASLIAAVATLRYETAAPLASTAEEAVDLAVLALVLAFAASVLVLAGLIVLTGFGDAGLSGMGLSVWAIPPTVAAIAGWTTLRVLQSRFSNFAAISTSSVWSSAVQSATQISAGALGLGAIWLIVGYALGRAANAWSLARSTNFMRWRGLRIYFALAVAWKRVAIMLTFPAALNVIGTGAVSPLVAAWFGISTAGQFGFALRVVAVPSALLGQAFAMVLFPRFAQEVRDDVNAHKSVAQAATTLLVIGMPLFGLVLLTGPDLFALLFGETWRQAGVASAILAPWFALSFISSPISGLAMVKNRFGLIMVLSIVELSLRLGGLALGLLTNSWYVGLVAYSLAGSLICINYLVWIFKLAGMTVRTWLASVRWYVVFVGLSYPAALALQQQGDWLGRLVAVVLTAVTATWGAMVLARQLQSPKRPALSTFN